MMLRYRPLRRSIGLALAGLSAALLTSCGWEGANSLPLPGTEGSGVGSYTVTIEMPNVTSIQRNSRVRVHDVTVGNVTDVQLQDWHALVTVRLDGGVALPKNATAKIGQTSLLGSLHVELAEPLDEQPSGALGDGDTIPLEHAGQYPTTEQTLAAVSVVLNGGGLGQLQEIDTQLNVALGGREADVRTFLTQLDTFTSALNTQKDDILTALEGLDRLALTANEQTQTLESALERIPPAIETLNRQKENLTGSVTSVGNFADVANRTVTAGSDDIQQNLRDLAPTLRELANAGPGLAGSLGMLPTFPWPLAGLPKYIQGDAGNLSATLDLTLGRIDANFLQGTPLAGTLYNAETALGRTVGRMPTADKNPLTAPLESVVIRGGQ
ncbi:MAG: MCE family protein [Hyphomicrobiales bacterium]|nr:MAG: MCE family protein [Hyphomicrobiales bacterium]